MILFTCQCRIAMTDTVDTVQCNNCKKDILSSNFVIHSVHCQRNIFLCSKCNEPVNYDKKADHDELNHTLAFCSSCNIQFEKCILNSHLVNDCPHRKVKCQICDIEVKAFELSEHENYCGSRTEKCSECGEYVMLKYKQLHIDSNHTFIKLSDEPGPSPSWQNGRRTLGNFLPDLDSYKFTPQSNHKKKSGRHESISHRSKGRHAETSGKEGKTYKHSDDVNVNKAWKDLSHSLPEKEGEDVSQTSKIVAGCISKMRIGSDSGSDITPVGSDEVPPDRIFSADSQKLSVKDREKGYSSTSRGKELNDTIQKPLDLLESGNDPDLDYALQVHRQLNREFHLNSEKLMAEAMEKNTDVLSEFSLFDRIGKNKNTINTFLGNNISDLNETKNLSKSRFRHYSDSSDDELINYAKKTEKKQEEVGLPCQFCNTLYPPHALMPHQVECNKFGCFNMLKKDKYKEKESEYLHGKSGKEDLVPCEICYRLMPISRVKFHMATVHSKVYRNASTSGK